MLVVKDEPAIAGTVVDALRAEGDVVKHRLLGRSGMQRLRAGGNALMVLDVGLANSDGFLA